MRIIFRNLIRHGKKNIITLFTVVFSTVLINAYMGNLVGNNNQLKELADITPVYCYITNMTGSRAAGLEISEKNVKQLLESEYVKDLVYTIKLNGCVGHIPEDEWYKLGYNVIAVNDISALGDITYDDITMDLGKYNDKDSFFKSAENVVLLSKDLMEKNRLETGDEIPVTLYYYITDGLDIFCRPLDYVTVTIAGKMEKSAIGADNHGLDIIFPTGYVEKVFNKNDKRVTMDSSSFYLKDPLKLNEAKQYFKSIYLLNRSSDAMESYKGIALCMKDATFISLAGNIVRNISLLKIFYVPLCFLIFALAFLLNFILIKNWQKEFVTMRLLGVYERQCVFIYCIEGLIISLAGVISGNVITNFVQKEKVSLIYSMLIILAGLAGTYSASVFTKKEMSGGMAWK